MQLVLQNQSTKISYTIPLKTDIRFLFPGSHHIEEKCQQPQGITPGTYDLFLLLPDPSPALKQRPEYSIRLANAGTWLEEKGYNSLLHTLTIE